MGNLNALLDLQNSLFEINNINNKIKQITKSITKNSVKLKFNVTNVTNVTNNYNSQTNTMLMNISKTNIAIDQLGDRIAVLESGAVNIGNKTGVLAIGTEKLANGAEKLTGGTDNLKEGVSGLGSASEKLESGFGKLANKLVNFENVKKILELADAFTMSSEKLKLINDGLQTEAELQDRVFKSANDSRSSYTDMASIVSNIGTKAGDSFGSTDELIAFSELMQKGVKLGGTGSEDQTTSMSYLTDAMGTGELGEEAFQSIIGAAPGIAEAISKYTGKSNEDLLSMASKGLLTSEILKNAMFASSDEINEKFGDMPMTFAQAWTLIQNDLLQTFQPLIEKIAEGASWIADNWSSIMPIFVGAAGAVGAYTIALGIMKIVTLASEIATKGLNATLKANPLMLIVTIIGLVIGVIYKWIQSVGGFKIAWLIVVDRVMYAWDWLKIGFFAGVYFVMDLLDKLQIGFMKMSVAISNFVGDMKVDFLNTFQNMVNGAIDIINGFLKKVSNFTGISFDLIEHVTFATDAALENEVDKQARNKGLENYIADKEALIEERDGKIKTMKQDALTKTAARQLEIASLQAGNAEKEDNTYGYDLYKEQSNIEDPITVEGTGSGGSVSVDMANQDLQYLRDMAERDYINKFSTATLAPNISVKFTGAISKDVDTDSMYRRIGKILTEEIAMAAEGVY